MRNALVIENFLSLFRDQLAGTDVYGSYSTAQSTSQFSVPFATYLTPNLRILFATGDLSSWLLTTYDQAAGSFYGSNVARTALQSSFNSYPCLFHSLLTLNFVHLFPDTVGWYQRNSFNEDPIISISGGWPNNLIYRLCTPQLADVN